MYDYNSVYYSHTYLFTHETSVGATEGLLYIDSMLTCHIKELTKMETTHAGIEF